MEAMEGRGDFIDGAWRRAAGDGPVLVSRDPAHDFQPLFRATSAVAHVEQALEAARAAQPGWHALGLDGRKKLLTALKASFDEHVELMSRTITREMGKPLREAQ